MMKPNRVHVLATLVFVSQFAFQWQAVWAKDVTYTLPYEAALVYPAENWLPAPYQKYYEGMTTSDCESHNNNPCATSACPTNSSLD